MKRLIILALVSLMAVVAANAQDKVRCSGTTVKGEQCKNYAKENGRCNIHSTTAFRCGAKTKKGTCHRIVKEANTRCWQHKG